MRVLKSFIHCIEIIIRFGLAFGGAILFALFVGAACSWAYAANVEAVGILLFVVCASFLLIGAAQSMARGE